MTSFIKMGCESDSFGHCVLGVEGYRVEGNICVHTLSTSQYRTITDAVQDPYTLQVTPKDARQPGDLTKGTVGFLSSRSWGLPQGIRADRSRLSSLPSGTGGTWKGSRQQKFSCC